MRPHWGALLLKAWLSQLQSLRSSFSFKSYLIRLISHSSFTKTILWNSPSKSRRLIAVPGIALNPNVWLFSWTGFSWMSLIISGLAECKETRSAMVGFGRECVQFVHICHCQLPAALLNLQAGNSHFCPMGWNIWNACSAEEDFAFSVTHRGWQMMLPPCHLLQTSHI